jgi:hypothetical protein
MAVASSVEKYTIRHYKEVEGSEVELPVYPDSITPSDNLVSNSWNLINGTMMDIPVALKLKFIWKWKFIDETNAELIYNTYIRNKIIQYKSRFFVINTFYPGIGFVSGLFYLGTPTNVTGLTPHPTKSGATSMSTLELHWIEVDGIKLNNLGTSVIS